MEKILRAALCVVMLGMVPALSSCNSLKGSKSSANTSKPAEARALVAAPEVTFKALDGSDVSLGSLKGKVVVVNFWATWCEPCQIEIPWMMEFQQKYASKGFTILGVAMDEGGKADVTPFVQSRLFDLNGQKVPMNYPIVIGNDDLADKFGGLIGLPTSVVLSRDGKMVKKFLGLTSHDTVEKQIQDLL
jgi:thiol-disulfide isomerase/thioredoxin